MTSHKQFRIDAILTEIQNLEEIGGPETLDEYIEILEAVKKVVDQRIQDAKTELDELLGEK